MRHLFFVEREFHIALFRNVAQYIVNHDLGEIGVFSFQYRAPERSGQTIGARPEVIADSLGVSFIPVRDPFAFAPDITYTADSNYERIEGLGTIVSLGHGTISKGSFFTGNGLMLRENGASLVCVPGPIHRNSLVERVCSPVEVTGMPKLDRLFDNSLNRLQILRELGLDPSRKTVLFAPTFNPELSLLPHLTGDLRRYFPREFNLIVKFHGAEANHLSGSDLAVVNDPDISSSLFAADILVTDWSSVIYEYLPLRRPVLLFDSPDRFSHSHWSDNWLENQYRDVGVRFADPESLPTLLHEALAHPVLPSEEIVQSFIGVRDGSSAQRVVESAIALHQEHQYDGTLLVHDQVDRYRQRFGNRFQVITHSEFIPEMAVGPVVVIGPGLDVSPLLPVYLSAHLRIDSSLGMVVPLLSHRLADNEQDVQTHFPQTIGLDDSTIARSLSYQAAGGIRSITKPRTDVFAVSGNELAGYLMAGLPSDFSQLSVFLQRRGKETGLALSALTWPRSMA
jgi:hypothetical protein